MTEPATPRSHDGAPGSTGAVVRDLGLGLLVSAFAAAPTWWLVPNPETLAVVIGLLYAALAITVARMLPADAPGPGVGAANRVTLVRASLTLPVLALACVLARLGPAAAWWVIVTSTVAMVLDGVDGRVARRTGTATRFGARFDMEFDALLILALAVLVWANGRAGPWVLAIGAMRYLFVAAGWVLPALRAELPERFRRKVVCVVQGVVLLVALGPIIPARMAVLVTAAGLVTLTWSFAVDVVWLLRAGRRPA